MNAPVGSLLWKTNLFVMTAAGVVLGVVVLVGGFPVWLAFDAYERWRMR